MGCSCTVMIKLTSQYCGIGKSALPISATSSDAYVIADGVEPRSAVPGGNSPGPDSVRGNGGACVSAEEAARWTFPWPLSLGSTSILTRGLDAH